MLEKKARVIAFYLPQFHPIPENDEHWGKGFTEWTNVGKAKPLFRGHNQPRVPADLGYYDLRMPEVREVQAEIAHEAGIEGFCYWHYWFGNGKRLLERPFNEVLVCGRPDFPFCLGWANHSWSNKTWKKEFSTKDGKAVIAEQLYPGIEDYTNHFYAVLDAFKDKRYIQVDGKPLFLVFDPMFEDLSLFIKTWRDLALKNGLKGIHFVATAYNSGYNEIHNLNKKKAILNIDEAALRYNYILSLGLDAVNSVGMLRAEYLVRGALKKTVLMALKKYMPFNVLDVYNHLKINKNLFVPEDKWENVYPTIMPNWDRSPRAGKDGTIYKNSTPQVFRQHIGDAIELVKDKELEHRIIFLKSWNEWGEGNYVEPDIIYGKGYLDALREMLLK
jgi:hypothetical protein